MKKQNKLNALCLMPVHLSKETWHDYFIKNQEHKMPYFVYLHVEDDRDRDFDTNIYVLDIDREEPLYADHSDNKQPLPKDLLTLLNYCIKHHIRYLSFYSWQDMFYKSYWNRIEPDLPVYDHQEWNFSTSRYRRWFKTQKKAYTLHKIQTAFRRWV